jgi:hypothetical protein
MAAVAEQCFEELEISRGNVEVVFEYIGEGNSGDYDPRDPRDEPLLRFSIYRKDPADVNGRKECEDASYCTQIPITTDRALVHRLAEHILDVVYWDVEERCSVKKLCERLSWITPEWLPKEAHHR